MEVELSSADAVEIYSLFFFSFHFVILCNVQCPAFCVSSMFFIVLILLCSSSGSKKNKWNLLTYYRMSVHLSIRSFLHLA